MNSIEFNKILQNSDVIEESQMNQLESIVHEFPYFQAAKAVHLKQLKKTASLKYNDYLKKTAAYTTDRKVLFEYVTTLNFTKKSIKEFEILEEIEVIDPVFIETFHTKIKESFTPTQVNVPQEISVITVPEIIASTTEVKQIKDDVTDEISITENPSTVLELGKPLQFSKAEPHSFNEWMQLISQKPIAREEKTVQTTEKAVQKIENSPKTEDKFSLIDRFIQTNPKIKPVDRSAAIVDITTDSNQQEDSLMTETLAKVYLEQKKYDSALQAYRILSLKYPEKSSFFAHRIKAIKILQKNKS